MKNLALSFPGVNANSKFPLSFYPTSIGVSFLLGEYKKCVLFINDVSYKNDNFLLGIISLSRAY